MNDGPPRRPRLGMPGNMRLGQGPVGPQGTLHDFEAFPGDMPPDAAALGSAASRWGRRQLFNVNPGNNLTDVHTLIETGDLGVTEPINLQIRFALADAQGNAIMPFSPALPTGGLGTGVNLSINVRRAVDPYAPVTVDTYNFSTVGATIHGNTLPVDTITTRNLGVEVTMVSPLGGSAQLWIEAIATKVVAISDQNRIVGWPVATARGLVPASLATAVFLQPISDRAQFIIVNASPDSDLYICFNAVATVATASIVLPRNMFATYESPVGGYRGFVSGIWLGGAPGGGAYVTDGSYF
jgi:hypothetical protein